MMKGGWGMIEVVNGGSEKTFERRVEK